MSDAQQIVPTDIPYTNEDVRRTEERPKLKEAWFKFRVIAAGPQSVSKNGNYQQALQLAPLDSMGNPKYPQIRHNITPPMLNPNHPGHTQPNTIFFCETYFQAASPKKFAPRAEKAPGGYLAANGKLLTMAEYKEANSKLRDDVFAELRLRWADPQKYIGDEFFARIGYSPDKNDPQKLYVNIKEFSAVEPLDALVEYEDFIHREAV